MYTAFYGLREKPFSLSPNPKFLFLAESHREALAHLLYGIDEGEGFIAITGEVGTGKTTLCRTLLERLGADTEVAFLFNPTVTPDELVRQISREFGLPVEGLSTAEMNDRLNAFLLEKKSEKRPVLLIIDEAQNLPSETLEQVRLISNLETASSKLIQILLLGQPELDRKLEMSELRQLRQRIGVRWRLSPLSLAETGEYIRYRLRIAAGVERDIFQPGAVREIHRRSGGVPRLVNILCDRSLLAGYGAGESRITRKLVRQAAREIPAAAGKRIATATRPASSGRASRVGWLFAGGIALLSLGFVTAASLGVPDWVPTANALRGIDVAAPPPDELARDSIGIVSPAEIIVRVHDERTTAPIVDPSLEAAAAQAPVQLASLAPIEPIGSGQAVGFLDAILAGQDQDLGRRQAVDAILRSYGMPPVEDTPRSETEALEWIEDAGLSVLPVHGADLELLRSLDYPVLLRLRTEEGESRLVALRRLGPELGELYGATGRGALEVQNGEIERSWPGRAFVVWRGFESLPHSLELGESGVDVLWLQDALRELGHFKGAPTGLFDNETEDGVRELQRSRNIVPDGVAGPQTLMVLYQLLERYDAPHLVAGDRS